MPDADTLPERIISDHVPLPVAYGERVWPRSCRACGADWPCRTFQRQLQGQSDNRADRMRSHMTVWALRLLSRPELKFLGPQVTTAMVGWIDGAVRKQQQLERVRDALTTGARKAVKAAATNIVTWWEREQQRRQEEILTPHSGLPRQRGVVGFGEVRRLARVPYDDSST